MASMFLTSPSSSSSSNLSSLKKKNPISTSSFSRYPLVKNPNFSFFRSPKTNSGKLLKFSANNNEKETNKTESSSMVNPLKEDDELKKTRNVSNELKRSISRELDPELDDLLARCAQITKEWEKYIKEKGNESNESERSVFEKLDQLIGPSAQRKQELDELEKYIEKFLQEGEKTESSPKVSPLKEDKELGYGDMLEEVMDFVEKPTIEKAENIEKLWMNKEKTRNPVSLVLNKNMLFNITNEKILLEHYDADSRLLNVDKMKRCFERDTFFITDIMRVRYRWTFTGFLKKPIEEVMPELEKKLSEAVGMDVIVYFSIDEYDMNKQVCTVEPKSTSDLMLEYNNQPKGNILAIVLCIASFGTTALMSSFLLQPNATFDDYLANVVPLFGGLFSILGVSEIATRITAARYGVKLSPSFLIPSIWTGFLGVVNHYESVLPNNKALFDIPVARTASAYLTSLVLMVTAFLVDGSFNGGDNPMYISPGFFSYNSLLPYIQSMIEPYRDDFGNVLPYVVEGVGVPVNPLAFAGILGIAVTSINLLPFQRREGGRITQALFGQNVARFLSSSLLLLLLAIAVSEGNVLCFVWFLLVTAYHLDETPVKDEVSPLGDERCTLGFILQAICILTLFPNIAGRFSVFHFFGQMYEVISSSVSYNS